MYHVIFPEGSELHTKLQKALQVSLGLSLSRLAVSVLSSRDQSETRMFGAQRSSRSHCRCLQDGVFDYRDHIGLYKGYARAI